MLDSYPFPVGFVICFAIGFVFMTAAIGCMALVREPPFVPRALDGPAGGRDTERPGLFRDARATLRRDSALRRYLGGRILLVIGGMAAAFFAVQATRTFGASAGDVAALTAVLLASQTLSTLFWGAGADRIGLTPVLFASAVLCAAAPAAALLAPDLLWFTLVFVLVGLSAGALAVTDAGMPLALAEGTGARERSGASAGALHRAQQHRPGPLPRGRPAAGRGAGRRGGLPPHRRRGPPGQRRVRAGHRPGRPGRAPPRRRRRAGGAISTVRSAA